MVLCSRPCWGSWAGVVGTGCLGCMLVVALPWCRPPIALCSCVCTGGRWGKKPLLPLLTERPSAARKGMCRVRASKTQRKLRVRTLYVGFLRREYVAISSQNQPNFWKSTILEPCRGARRRRRRQSGGPPLPLQQPLYLYRRVLQRAGFLAVDTHAAPRGFDVRLE